MKSICKIVILVIVFLYIIPLVSCGIGYNVSRSPETGTARNTEESSYLPNQQEEFSDNQTKSEAMQALKEEILKLGGSETTEAQPLLNEWWNSMISTGEFKPLSEVTIENLQEHVDMLHYMDCFYFAEELNGVHMMYPCYFLCYKYYDSWPNMEVQQNYPPEYAEKNNAVVLPEDTVRKLVKDILGLNDYSLKSYYAARKKELPGDLYREYQQEKLEFSPMYRDYMDREDVLFYVTGDDVTPVFYMKRYAYLGDGMYYVILEGGWWYDNEAPTLLDDMHLVIKETDTFFGFEVVAMLQNNDGSLLKPEWEPPC